MDDYLPTAGWHRLINDGLVCHKYLFGCATLFPLLIVGWLCVLNLIRWVNWEPEKHNIRLLWICLWSAGAGFLMIGIVSLLMVRRLPFN